MKKRGLSSKTMLPILQRAEKNNYKYQKQVFIKGHKLVAQAVQQYANEFMEEALKSTQDTSIFSGDGCYPIRRNYSHCSFDIKYWHK